MRNRPNSFASAWYVGRITHTRHAPVRHHFDHSIMMGLFDLDELDRLQAEVRGFGVDRWSPIGFRTADHGPADGSSLRAWATGQLSDAGLDPGKASGPIRLLCMPRTCGFGFDPITVWFLHDADGVPSALIHEVRNTFGHRHAYVAPIDRPAHTPWRQHADKTLHVSPFFDRDGGYDFTVMPPQPTDGSRMSLRIDYRNVDGLLLRASFVGERRPFSTRGMLGAVLHSPAVTHKAIVGIHVEALKLWRKGLAYRSVPQPPQQGVTAGTACPIARSQDQTNPSTQNQLLKGTSR